MISQVLLLLILAAAMVALILGMARKPEIAIIAILSSELIATHYQLPSLPVGSVTIFASDIPTVALLAATVVRPYLGVRRRQVSTAILSIFLIAILGLVRGSRAFGLQLAGNNAREILAFCAAALFFSTVTITPDFIKYLRRWLTLSAIFVIAVGIVFWMQNGFGEFSSGGQRGLRGLDALILLFATLTSIVIPYGRTRTQNLIAPAIGFLVLVLALQRSVAVAGIVSLIVIVLFGGRLRTRRSSRVTRILLIVGGLSVGLLILAGPTGLTTDLSTAVETTTTQEGTFSWRLEGWQILIKDQLASPIQNILLGKPAGAGSSRVIGETVVTVAPHSMYVSLFGSVGLIGLAIMIWLLASTFRRNIVNVRSEFTFTATVGLLVTALLAAQVTYFISYSAGFIAGLIIGLAASLAWFGAIDPENEALQGKLPSSRSPDRAARYQPRLPQIDEPILP
ncbi:MAG: hypothetical protein WCJ88_11480 [Actinomycetes bacterium]